MGQLDLFGFGSQPEPTPKKKSKKVVDIKETPDTDHEGTPLQSDEVDAISLDVVTSPVELSNRLDDDNESNLIAENDDASMYEAIDNSVAQLTENTGQSSELNEDLSEANGTFENEPIANEEPVAADQVNDQPSDVMDEPATEFLPEPQVNNDDVQAPTVPDEQQEDNGLTHLVFTDGKIGVKFKVKKLKEVKPAESPTEIEEKPVVIEKIVQKRGRKSFKEIDAEVDLIEVPDDDVLYARQYYPISTVAGWFKVNTSLLRFWENEFDILKPRKNRKGDRLFRPEDIKNLKLIYHLLREKKYTIDGAREFLRSNKKKADTQLQLTQTLQKFKSFLLELRANLQE